MNTIKSLQIPVGSRLIPNRMFFYTLHYAEVVEIGISKCPTLTNYFSVVYHPGCPKFCVGLRKLPKNLEKAFKEKFEGEKEEKNA